MISTRKEYKRKYFEEYNQRPEVKERRREYARRYCGYGKWRKYSIEKRKEYAREYAQEYMAKRRLGNPYIIRSICLDYGFSEEASTIIAVNGEVLDAELKKPIKIMEA